MSDFTQWLMAAALVWGGGILIGITLGAFAIQWSTFIVKRYFLPASPCTPASGEEATHRPKDAGPYTSPASGYGEAPSASAEPPLPSLDQNAAFYLAAKCAAPTIIAHLMLRGILPHVAAEWQSWVVLGAWLGAAAALGGSLSIFLSISLVRAILITAVFVPIYGGLWFVTLLLLAGRLLGSWLDKLFGW